MAFPSSPVTPPARCGPAPLWGAGFPPAGLLPAGAPHGLFRDPPATSSPSAPPSVRIQSVLDREHGAGAVSPGSGFESSQSQLAVSSSSLRGQGDVGLAQKLHVKPPRPLPGVGAGHPAGWTNPTSGCPANTSISALPALLSLCLHPAKQLLSSSLFCSGGHDPSCGHRPLPGAPLVGVSPPSSP